MTGKEFGFGFDKQGRSGFLFYFRPPGLPPTNFNNSANLSTNQHNVTHGYESFRNPINITNQDGSTTYRQYWGAMPWNWNGNTSPVPPPPPPPTIPPNPVGCPLTLPTFVGDINAGFVLGNATSGNGPPSLFINPNNRDPAGQVLNAYAGYGIYPGQAVVDPSLGVVPSTSTFNGLGSLYRDTPDETNLYVPNNLDASFSASDLEWLYRFQDIDGSSLSSRLGQLVPETFVQPPGNLINPTAEAQMRRQFFSVESWDLNNYAWANDNPGAVIVGTSWVGPYVNNHRFLPYASAGNYNQNAITPALAQRGRRINLNQPLPCTPQFDSSGNLIYDPGKDPIEPVRQKWIRDTYTLLRETLPPKAVDTPEELAQLSQFVVNIVDFRDPDGTPTKFVNTDITVTPATGEQSAQLAFTTTAPTVPYDPTLTESSTTKYLIQYGMEYNPVAINEVLAFYYKNKNGDMPRFFLELVNTLTQDNGDGTGNGGACDLTLDGWDIVVQPEDGTNDGLARPDPYTGQLPYSASPPSNRKTVPLAKPKIVNNNTAGCLASTTDQPAPIWALNAKGDVNRRNVCVLGYDDPAYNPTTKTGSSECPAILSKITYSDPPTNKNPISETPLPPDAILRNPTDPTQKGKPQDILPAVPPTGTAPSGQYCWLYLRRPLIPVSITPYQPDPAQANYNPMVVVDTERFPYFYTDGKYTAGTPPTCVPGTQDVWSNERFQPYRGGQAVPNPAVGAMGTDPMPVAFGRPVETSLTTKVLYPDPTWGAYGYSEQTRIRDVGQSQGLGDPADYDTTWVKTTAAWTAVNQMVNFPNNTAPKVVTRWVHEDLNEANSNVDASWDPFVFHDRDFQSVAELMLVPCCPPGLFTKQFAEQPNGAGTNAVPLPGTASGKWPNVSVPLQTPTNDPKSTNYNSGNPPNYPKMEANPLPANQPHVYPFLTDKFFHTADGQDFADNPINAVADHARHPPSSPRRGGRHSFQ